GSAPASSAPASSAPATGSAPASSAPATGSAPASSAPATGSAPASSVPASSAPASGSASATSSAPAFATSPVCVPGVHTSTNSDGSVETVTVVCPGSADSTSESVPKTTPIAPTSIKPELVVSTHGCVPGKITVVEHGETIVSTVVCEATATQSSSNTISTTGPHDVEQPSSGVTVTTFAHSTKPVESSASITVETPESSASGTRSIVVPGEATASGSSDKPVVVPSTSGSIAQTNASPKLGLNGGMMVSALIIAVLMI
ncbi:hypothetical protein DS838_001762, partial [Geotrichum bryndzae]